MARTGIFGGSFNPMHNGHLVMGLEAMETQKLDRLIVVPVHLPPHKGSSELLPGSVRLRLARAAVAGLRGIEVDDREVVRGGLSYSIDTVLRISEEHPGDEIYFLIGEDSVEDLPKWRAIERLSALVSFLVSPRPSGSPIRLEEPGSIPGLRLHRLAGTLIGISSTQVRERAKTGRPLRGFVPDAVAALIEAEGLFQNDG